MRHLVDHRKLGRTASHRRSLLRNLATSLVLSERIETTLPKALEVRRVADKLITLAKAGTLHARRQAASILLDEKAVKKLFDGLGQRFTDRQGGYTRIYKFGFRRGDSAEMAAIEYLGYQLPEPKQEDEKRDEKKPKAKTEVKRSAAPKVEKSEKKKEKQVSKKAEGKNEGKISKKTDDKKLEKRETANTSNKKGKWGLFGRGKGKED